MIKGENDLIKEFPELVKPISGIVQLENGSVYLQSKSKMYLWNLDANPPIEIPELHMPSDNYYQVSATQNGVGFFLRFQAFVFRNGQRFKGKDFPDGNVKTKGVAESCATFIPGSYSIGFF